MLTSSLVQGLALLAMYDLADLRDLVKDKVIPQHGFSYLPRGWVYAELDRIPFQQP